MHKIIVLKHPSGERLPLLLSESGFPLIEPNLFIFTKRGMAWRTLKKKLDSIYRFHEWASEHSIDLTQRIDNGKLFTEEEINQSLCAYLRVSNNRNKFVSKCLSAGTFNIILLYVHEYLAWRFNTFLMRLPSSDPQFQALQTKQKIILSWIIRLQLSRSAAITDFTKALSSHQLETLLSIAHPQSSLNPWSSLHVRHRNYLIVLILLNFGIRPAELLTLRVTDFDFGALSSLKVIRRPHDPDDPRVCSPEVKRKGRWFTVEIPLAKLVDNYIMEWRPHLDNKHEYGTEFLILSEVGNPLSYPAVAKVFEDIKNASDGVLPKRFTSGWLRHTFSSSLEKKMRDSGIPEERRREILMVLRGDSSSKSQDVYIHAAIKEEAQDYLIRHQANIFKTDNSGEIGS